jgi:nucleoside-diphosphate-sugar epimerase
MKVFVAGGTGAVGGHAIPALVREGHTVTALARTPEKAAALTAQGATAVSVSLFDRSALTAVFAGHEAVINLASAIPPMTRFMSVKAWQNNDRVRMEGSAAVVDAALAAGVGRVVQESVSMLYRDQGTGWVGEDAPIDRYPTARGNLAAETNAHRFSEAGGAGIVLHAPAGTFNIVDDEPLTKREYADALARAAGKTMWLRGPGRAALVFGDRLTSLTRSLRVSNARFRTATGWAPRYPSAREGWIATATALKHSRIAA